MRKHPRSPSPFIIREDLANGLLEAALSSASFSLALGFHPVVPIVAFLDGVLGRHWARLRTNIAFRGGDGVASNAAALLTHAAIGTAKMGIFLNPIAGYGIPIKAILGVSLANSLSKGSFRLVFDKAFVREIEPTRAKGVAYASLLTFGQGLLVGLVYKGSTPATVLQLGFAATGLGLLLAPLALRVKDRWERRRAVEGRIIRINRIRHASINQPELVA